MNLNRLRYSLHFKLKVIMIETRKRLALCFILACVCFLFYSEKINLFPTNIGHKNSSILLERLRTNTTKLNTSTVQVKGVIKKLQTTTEDSRRCKVEDIKLSHDRLPVTGLVSFPGSGNTWTRHLIQQMTGFGTSSCYCDDALMTNGFPFECFDKFSMTVVVKTHEFQHVQQYKFEKIVLLIRNPYDALVSFANFVKGRHTGHASIPVLKQVVSRTFNSSLQWYIELTNNTINKFHGPVHILQYEQLKTNMTGALWNLAKFLDTNVTQEDIDCTVELQEGNFHRKVTNGYHLKVLKEVYRDDELLRLKEATEWTAKILKTTYGVDLDVGGPLERLLLEHKERLNQNNNRN